MSLSHPWRFSFKFPWCHPSQLWRHDWPKLVWQHAHRCSIEWEWVVTNAWAEKTEEGEVFPLGCLSRLKALLDLCHAATAMKSCFLTKPAPESVVWMSRQKWSAGSADLWPFFDIMGKVLSNSLYKCANRPHYLQAKALMAWNFSEICSSIQGCYFKWVWLVWFDWNHDVCLDGWCSFGFGAVT